VSWFHTHARLLSSNDDSHSQTNNIDKIKFFFLYAFASIACCRIILCSYVFWYSCRFLAVFLVSFIVHDSNGSNGKAHTKKYIFFNWNSAGKSIQKRKSFFNNNLFCLLLCCCFSVSLVAFFIHSFQRKCFISINHVWEISISKACSSTMTKSFVYVKIFEMSSDSGLRIREWERKFIDINYYSLEMETWKELCGLMWDKIVKNRREKRFSGEVL
jgi:hypothetical protein